MIQCSKFQIKALLILLLTGMYLASTPAMADEKFFLVESDWRSTVETAKISQNGEMHFIGKQSGRTRYGEKKVTNLQGGQALARISNSGQWSKAIPINGTVKDLLPMGAHTHVMIHRRTKTKAIKKGKNKQRGKETQIIAVQRVSPTGNIEDEMTIATMTGGYFKFELTGQFGPNGDIYIWGHWTGNSVDLNATKLTKKDYGGAWIAKYSSSGDLRWSQNFEGGVNNFTALKINAIAVGPKNNLHLVGSFGKTARLGNKRHQTDRRPSENDRRVPMYEKGTFLVNLNLKGGVIRATKVGLHDLSVKDLTIESDGSALIGGSYRGTDNEPEDGEEASPIPVLGSLKLRDTGNGHGAFIAKYSAAHKPKWAQAFTSYKSIHINSLALHGNKIVATGAFYKNAQIGSRKLIAPDRHIDAFMVALTSSGEIESVRHFTGADREKVTVTAGPNNQALLYGSFRANMAAKGRINTSGGRYENGFVYLLGR